MATITLFTNQEKATHQSHKFPFSLKPTNYVHWKQMLEPFLISHNLFGYVDGTIPSPSPTDNPSFNPWVMNDAHVRLLITSTISEQSFQHVQGHTSRDIWLSLERAYVPVSVSFSHEFALKTRLFRITMESEEKPAEYLRRAQEYATALANIGEPIKDKDLVMLIVTGLREDYNGFKDNLLARDPVRFSELHGLLSDHVNQRIKHSLYPMEINDVPTDTKDRDKLKQLRKVLDLMVHAPQCKAGQCQYPKCRKVKELLRHGMQCKIRTSGGCPLCKKMWHLLQLHARSCKDSPCTVPRCRDLRERLRTQQADSRRVGN